MQVFTYTGLSLLNDAIGVHRVLVTTVSELQSPFRRTRQVAFAERTLAVRAHSSPSVRRSLRYAVFALTLSLRDWTWTF